MLHCDLRVRWKVASDLRFRTAISEPKTHYFCRISGDLAPSTRKSLAIAIAILVRQAPQAVPVGKWLEDCHKHLLGTQVVNCLRAHFPSAQGMCHRGFWREFMYVIWEPP